MDSIDRRSTIIIVSYCRLARRLSDKIRDRSVRTSKKAFALARILGRLPEMLALHRP
jgi:hypothetical protein